MTRLGLDTWVLTRRLLIRWGRDPQTVVESLVLPVFFLLTLELVFGQTISGVGAHDALYGTVPMSALVGALFGSTAAGITLMRERSDGLLSRLWVLPVHRAAGPLSRLAAEAARVVVTTVLVLCAGVLLGFRFQQGFWAGVGWVVLPAVFGLAFSTVVATLALYIVNTALVQSTGVAITLLVFFCTGFVPLAQYPRWVQPVVEFQPMSLAVDAMRGMAVGGPVLWPAIGTVAWSAIIAAACAVPMARGYRKASMR